MNKSDFNQTVDKLSGLIDSFVQLEPTPPADKITGDVYHPSRELTKKLDVLERAIELIRIRTRTLGNSLEFDIFTQGHIGVEANSLIFCPPGVFKRNKPGTPPIHLQPKLLIYLLYRYKNKEQKVIRIIENFIRLIWSQLKILDFEKTKTGVMRCFTNTRFAANTLRDYGMLKYTKQEAYKTWILSFTGLMVAAKFLKDDEWRKPITVVDYGKELNPNIRNTFESLKDYGEFLETLVFITKPETKLFNKNSVGTRETHNLISIYHEILKDEAITNIERKKHCHEILKKLEQDENIKTMFNNLKTNLELGELKQL